jgi:hypothetical protein
MPTTLKMICPSDDRAPLISAVPNVEEKTWQTFVSIISKQLSQYHILSCIWIRHLALGTSLFLSNWSSVQSPVAVARAGSEPKNLAGSRKQKI